MLVLSTTAGATPGGAGHLIAGEKRTGLRLLAIGGAGLGGIAVAGLTLFVTGASRRYVAPVTGLTIGSAGLFLGAILADVYGLVAPEGGFGSPPAAPATLEASLGYRHVHDPARAARAFTVADLELRRGRASAGGSMWLALDEAEVRVRARGAFRLLRGEGGSYLELEGALTHHRQGGDGVSTTLGELFVMGRLDLERVGPSLAGSFGELGVGYAAGAVRYHDLTTEQTDLLLGHIAFGFYLGHGAGAASEIAVTYDHRHDDFAAGFKAPGPASGPVGHFGLRFSWVGRAGWGVLAEGQVGSAWVGGVSLVHRRGGLR